MWMNFKKLMIRLSCMSCIAWQRATVGIDSTAGRAMMICFSWIISKNSNSRPSTIPNDSKETT